MESDYYKMTIKKKVLKQQQMTRFMRLAGFSRVSDDASHEFGKIMEKFALKLAVSAKNTMDVGGRKTPKKGDFKQAWFRTVKLMGGSQIDINDVKDYNRQLQSPIKIKKVTKNEKRKRRD